VGLYDDIPAGYYLERMRKGPAVQRFFHTQELAKISSGIPDNPRITLLDMGCGPGSFFFQHRKRGRKIGMDIAPDQILYARRLMPRNTWICADIEKAPLPKADYIILSEVLEHLSPKTRILQRARDALRKNGRLIITTPNYASAWPLIERLWELVSTVKYKHQHINPQTPARLKRLAQAAGLRLVELRTIFPFTLLLACVSERLARKALPIEDKFFRRLGLIIFAVFEKAPRTTRLKYEAKRTRQI
jgi:SAM-dependent methyltransferase